jgi:putative ABC transport system permease protein
VRELAADLRLAWWQARGQTARLWLLIACVALGIAARVGIGTFSHAVERALAREARPLLGGDLEIAGRAPLDADHSADLDRLLPRGARRTAQVGFVSMVAGPEGRSHLVEVRGVEAGHPLGGRTRALGADGAELPLSALEGPEPAIFAQRELLDLLGLPIGGTLRLGTSEVRVAGVLREDPGMGANPFVLGPRVLIALARARETGLLGPGARARWSTLVACEDPAEGERLAKTLRSRWGLPERGARGFGGRVETPSGIEVRSAAEAQESTARFFRNLGDFLRLVALAALLLGGVGIASMVRGFVVERLESVAALQVLGAAPGRVARIWLLLALGVGLAGGIVGAFAGAAFADLLAWLLAERLPVPLGYGVDPGQMAIGAALGVGAAGLFAALPLLEVGRLSPLAIMRGDATLPRVRLASAGMLVGGLALVAVVAALDSRTWLGGPLFVGVVAVEGLVLYGLARVALPLLARLRPRSFGARHGLSNLARPGFRPAAAAAAIGLATLIVASTLIYQVSLGRELDPGRREAMPSLFAIDLQVDQRDEFAALVRQAAGCDPLLAPVVHARFRGMEGAVAGTHGARERLDAHAAERGEWFRNREQNLSWRDELGPDERIIAGTWMHDDPDHPEASLEKSFASSIGATVGSRIAFDIQGVTVEAAVTSIRTVRWAGLKPNFFILLNASALRDAPQTWVASVPALDSEARARLQAGIVSHFPNVTVIDVTEAATRIRGIVDRIIEAVQVMGAFALAAGLVVLLGIGLSTARERRVDAALIAMLGGRPRTLITSLSVEFGALGLLSGLIGLGLAIALGWAQLTLVAELPLAVPWGQLAILAAAVAVICAVAGVLACRRAISAPPLEALREG